MSNTLIIYKDEGFFEENENVVLESWVITSPYEAIRGIVKTMHIKKEGFYKAYRADTPNVIGHGRTHSVALDDYSNKLFKYFSFPWNGSFVQSPQIVKCFICGKLDYDHPADDGKIRFYQCSHHCGGTVCVEHFPFVVTDKTLTYSDIACKWLGGAGK